MGTGWVLRLVLFSYSVVAKLSTVSSQERWSEKVLDLRRAFCIQARGRTGMRGWDQVCEEGEWESSVGSAGQGGGAKPGMLLKISVNRYGQCSPSELQWATVLGRP